MEKSDEDAICYQFCGKIEGVYRPNRFSFFIFSSNSVYAALED